MTFLAYKTMIAEYRRYQSFLGYPQIKLRFELISDWTAAMALYANFYRRDRNETKQISLDL